MGVVEILREGCGEKGRERMRESKGGTGESEREKLKVRT